MINAKVANRIRKDSQTYWDSEVRKRYFREIAQGKEIGHRIADLVDEKTTALLTVKYVTKHQYDSRGQRRMRSMGDLWLESGGIYHPVNVKAGVTTTGGQPNMVSLKKLLRALLSYQIDSYYLLIVKMDIARKIACRVYFLDLLDHLPYMTFDSGPGQIMLKANAFYDAMAKGASPPTLTIRHKVKQLYAMLKDGEKRLAVNRAESLARFHEDISRYLRRSRRKVTADTQNPLNLR